MSVTFRIIDMDYDHVAEDGVNKQIVIHLAGITEDNKTVYCKVLNYQPYCFLELPVDIKWTDAKVESLANHIRTKLQECPPDTIKFEIKKLCLYSVTRPFLRINFKTEDSWKHLRNLLKYTWRVEGFLKEFPAGSFKLHEQKVPTLVKFGIERKLDMAGWVTVKTFKPPGLPMDYSLCDYSIYTKAHWVSKSDTITSEILVDPKICSFDIELHSVNRKSSSPEPSIPENVITMISLTFGRLTQPLEDWETFVITQYVGDEEPDGKYKSTVIDCKGSEQLLLVNFTKILKRNLPDIITGYNINGFDWGCLLTRAEIYGLTSRFYKMGKLKFEKDRLQDMPWASSARGAQEIKYIKLKGVFNFDLFPEIRFNHSLPTYKLSAVAKHFLHGEDKEDMPYQQMFAIFDMVEVLERSLENCIDMQPDLAKKLIISKTKPEELLKVDGMTNHVAEFYDCLKECTTLKKIVKTARSFMLRLIKYVIQDARICPALMKFLNSLTSLWENSIISKCPPSYIYEKGQQIKVLAQYIEKAYPRNYVAPHYEKAKDVEEDDDGKKNYQGATVLKVKKGLYKNIATLDFASLYPSIMRAYNICHTQLVPPEISIPDEECNIAKWSEHIRCEHDPEKRKKKKGEKAFCGDHYYRWRKHYGQEEKKGLLPLLLDNLMAARSKVKKEMQIKQQKWEAYKVKEFLTEEEKKDMELTYRISTVLDARQLAIKISANSSYGFLGAVTGYLPLLEGAASVTYYGREAIQKTISIIKNKWSFSEVIYGDSVTADTPILVLKDSVIDVKKISDLCHIWNDYPNFLKEGTNKECGSTPYKVWSDKGWVQVKKVIRHKCNKNIYRVESRFGVVEVTQDHSLINDKMELLKPENLVIGETKLLHHVFGKKNFGTCDTYFTSDKIAAMLYMCKTDVFTEIEYRGVYIVKSTSANDNTVTKVTKLSTTASYVYDLETECGRFHAGVGFNIVKNTDSVFVDFHTDDLKKVFELAHEAEEFITKQFPPEMKIVADNTYSPLLLLTKKRYEYSIVTKEGKVLKDGSKGSINKRHDNCDVAREIYTFTQELVKNGRDQDQTIYEINNKILDMYRGLYPLKNFIIYKGLKQEVEEYANCAGHVLFAKRLEERGNVLKAGTRLEYVFVKKRDKNLKSGDLMEDFSYFLMNRQKDNIQLDYGYYLEHNIMVPVTEVLNIAFPIKEVAFSKLEENFKRALEVYLKPKWAELLRGKSIEYKAKYVSKYSKNKKLRNPARTFFARVILDKMYKQHGLKKRTTPRPKNGQTVIYQNDKIIQQIYNYHRDYNQVLWQIMDRRNIHPRLEKFFLS